MKKRPCRNRIVKIPIESCLGCPHQAKRYAVCYEVRQPHDMPYEYICYEVDPPRDIPDYEYEGFPEGCPLEEVGE